MRIVLNVSEKEAEVLVSALETSMNGLRDELKEVPDSDKAQIKGYHFTISVCEKVQMMVLEAQEKGANHDEGTRSGR